MATPWGLAPESPVGAGERDKDHSVPAELADDNEIFDVELLPEDVSESVVLEAVPDDASASDTTVPGTALVVVRRIGPWGEPQLAVEPLIPTGTLPRLAGHLESALNRAGAPVSVVLAHVRYQVARAEHASGGSGPWFLHGARVVGAWAAAGARVAVFGGWAVVRSGGGLVRRTRGALFPSTTPPSSFVLRHLGDIVAVGATLSVGLFAGSVWARQQATPPPAAVQPTLPAAAVATPLAVAPAGPTVAVGGPGDWADSVHLPDWVVRMAPPSGPTKSYVPLGGGRGLVLSGDDQTALAATSAATSALTAVAAPVAVDLSRVHPILVQRAAGQHLVVRDLEFGARTTARRLAVPGRCRGVIETDPAQPGVARELGTMSEWVFALAVPSDVCVAASGRAATRLMPTASERRGLAAATANGAVPRQLGAPAFAAADLREFQVATVDGVRMAWGVFRRPVRSTQLVPPPPLPQLAFVARLSAEGWEILWAKYSDTSAELLGLAGVYDVRNVGVPDAFFAVRGSAGSARALVVGRHAAGQWALARTIPL